MSQPIWSVGGHPATLDTMLGVYLEITPKTAEEIQLYGQAVEIYSTRQRFVKEGARPPALLAWLPILEAIKKAIG